jgi:hypothetical protein
MTYRDVISTIRGMSKLLAADDLINDRVLMGEVRAAANLIVGQALAKRKYWNSPTLFAPILCLEMEPIKLSECCEYAGERVVAISKKSLPRIGEGLFGQSIQGVFGMDGTKKFSPTNPNRYSNLLKLKLPNQEEFFWVRNDGRVVVTNEDTLKINMFVYFTEPIPNDLLYPGEDCDCIVKPSLTDLCTNPLDQNFFFIDERLFDLKQLVYKNLMATYFGIQADVTSDNKDDTVRR